MDFSPYKSGSILPLVAVLGCSSIESSDATAVTAYDPASGDEAPQTSSGSDVEPEGSTGEDGAGYGSEEGGGTTGADEPPGPVGTAPGCPDRLPPSWLFCEDFETVDDLTDIFFDYQDGDGSFGLDHGNAASGYGAMKAVYRKGQEGAGWLSVAFGRNPVVYGEAPHVAPDENFQEVYWRLRIKVGPHWPGLGPGQLADVTAFAGSDWSQAMVARLFASESKVVLSGEASSCVLGGEPVCTGFEDTAGLRPLAALEGTTPLFAADQAEIWHCVEGHVAMNSPGANDGVFEFWVDDVPQDSRTDLNWRGTWAQYGLNLLTIRNLWPGGAPEELERSIDDLVIATEPIGCDGDVVRR